MYQVYQEDQDQISDATYISDVVFILFSQSVKLIREGGKINPEKAGRMITSFWQKWSQILRQIWSQLFDTKDHNSRDKYDQNFFDKNDHKFWDKYIILEV